MQEEKTDGINIGGQTLMYMNQANIAQQSIALNHEAAEQSLKSSVANEHPEWVESDGECTACVSIYHELANPFTIPSDL